MERRELDEKKTSVKTSEGAADEAAVDNQLDTPVNGEDMVAREGATSTSIVVQAPSMDVEAASNEGSPPIADEPGGTQSDEQDATGQGPEAKSESASGQVKAIVQRH